VSTHSPRSPAVRLSQLGPLVLGLAALAAGTAFGWNATLVSAVVTPPALVRAGLVAAAVVGGGWLFVGGLRRMGASPADPSARPDLPTMVRGIRLVFLGVAALAAAVGWILGHPLPIVIALVIAGVDVLETSFLLLVVRRRQVPD
jgi:hypothetical protein